MNSAAAPGIAAGRRRRQLPAEVSAFVGRTDELAALAGLLRRGRHATVTGPGGVGKTRLALRAATDAAHRYPDGARLVDLAGLADAAQLPLALSEGLGLRGHDPRPARAAVLDQLRDQRLLLILDTCEHLAAAVARFAAHVLRETDGITILATSRQPLQLAGETVLRLGPLPVPEAGRDPGPGDAVELFATRAAAALPGFTISDAERPDVIRICRRVDGVPLGLELAAVRVRALPLAELADRLDASFSVLAGARRGAVPRHRDLQAALDWSHRLCTEAERALWERLSVFAGAFDLAAAREVAACPLVPADRVGEVLAALVDKSVVLRADGSPASGAPDPEHRRAGPAGPRYRLTASARAYGADRLAAADLEAAGRRRHARRYLRLALGFRRHLLADDQAARLRDLHAEHAEFVAALEHGFAAAEPGRRRAAARLATVLLPYWLMSGRLGEGVRWQDAVLGLPAGVSAAGPSALANRAVLGAMLGRPGAVADARAAIAAGARGGHDRAGGLCHLALPLALGLGGAYRESVAAAGRARPRLTGAGADTTRRCLDLQLGHAHQLAGDVGAAAAAGERALAGLGPGERWLRGYVAITSAEAERYAQLRAREAVTPIEQIVALAVAGDDALPSVPGPRTAGDDRQRTAAGQGGRDGQPDAGELTSREREIAALVARGLSNRQIADRLYISRRTVDAHVNHIYAKLGISSRVQLTIWERDRGPGSRPDELSPTTRA